MKTKNIAVIILTMLSLVFVDTAIAEAPKPQPAQEALKGVQPFIGNWTAESDAYDGFEGNEKGGKIDMVFRFRWLQEKAAVEFSDGATIDVDELLAFARSRLGRHKVPRSIDVHEALPRQPNGKLYLDSLRAPYWAGRERKI